MKELFRYYTEVPFQKNFKRKHNWILSDWDQDTGRTWASHADLLQVFILDVVEVGESCDVEVITDAQEVLLQLHICQQLQQPLRPLLTLHLHTHIHLV